MKEIVLNTVKTNYPNYRKYKALVDDEDFESLSKYNWSIFKGYNTLYAQGYINRKVILMHQFLTGYKITDHIDHNGLNNQRNNLRDVTHQLNQANELKTKSPTSSKFKGVHWATWANSWRVQIKANYKNIHLGYFKSEIEGAKAYNKKALELYGEFANLNQLP